MSAALKTPESLGPEALAFIKEGMPKARAEGVGGSAIQSAANAIHDEESEPSAAEPPASVKPARIPVSKPEPISPVVGLSFRLPVDIHQALMRVSLERRLQRQRPWTQQEIAAEAFAAWLKKNGCER